MVFLTDGRAVSGTPAQLLASDDANIVEFLAAEDRNTAPPPRKGAAAGASPEAGGTA